MLARLPAILLHALLLPCFGTGRVKVGLEVAQSEGWPELLGKRTVVLCTPAAVFPDSLAHVVDELSSWDWRQRGINLVGVLAAEHGFRGDRQAEHGDPQNYTDRPTGLTVYSVYRKSRGDLQALLAQLDAEVLLVDFQDVGTRLYTFIWTMFDLMDAITARGHTVPQVVVLDRPNPLGGVGVEGPLLNTSCCSSRYGKWPIPHRHGLTIGEISLLLNGMSFASKLSLKVYQMENWLREMMWLETGLPWIPPSPNLPTPASAVAYAEAVFIEATTVSEGRGTCTPFSLLGAPFINASHLADALNTAVGVKVGQERFFRAAYFTPTFFKYNFTVCAGVQSVRLAGLNASSCIANSGSTAPSLFETSLHILHVLKRLYPKHFQWDGSWFGVAGSRLVDLYAGTPRLREYLDAGWTPRDVAAAFAQDSNAFEKVRAPYLLYEAAASQIV